MQIERPNWLRLMDLDRDPDLSWGQTLDKWFKEEVEPINKILSEGTEVYSPTAGFIDVGWKSKKNTDNHNYKALLINIQPIKKETAEDVLRAYMEQFNTDQYISGMGRKLHERAKAVLGEN